jgi:hypothetical protein
MTQHQQPWRARGFALAAGLLYLAACQPGEVTKPDATETAAARPTAARPLGSPEQLAALGAALEDATSHLVPSLDDRVGAVILRIHLDELSGRVAAGDAAGARRALASARRALDIAGGVGARESVTSSAIRLVLDHTEAVLNGRDVTQVQGPARLNSSGGAPAARR